MKKNAGPFWRNTRGATSIEWALTAALIALVILTVVALVGVRIMEHLDKAFTEIRNAVPSAAGEGPESTRNPSDHRNENSPER